MFIPTLLWTVLVLPAAPSTLVPEAATVAAATPAIIAAPLAPPTQEPTDGRSRPNSGAHEVPTEDQLGLTFFKPQHASASALINYTKELTDSRVYYLWRNPATGHNETRTRDRFVEIQGNVGVQGVESDRSQAIALLRELDTFVGANVASSDSAPKVVTRTVRLRSLPVGAAEQLLATLGGPVERQVVVETGTIVLRGPFEDVARAESLLVEVDQPSPRMTLHVTIVEAVEGEAPKPLAPALARGLSTLAPGKTFTALSHSVLASSVAPNTGLELASTFGVAQELSHVNFRARSRGWDAASKRLTLGNVEVQCARPQFAKEGPGAGNQVVGQDKFGFSTDLTLLQGQDTVVGSLGGDSLFVVLRFTVDDLAETR